MSLPPSHILSHCLPLLTCARARTPTQNPWQACIYGRKKWILCPPDKPPPGVTASDDGANVTSPISLYEWFRVFYSSLAEVRRDAAPGEVVALEATVEAGEILFVPSGWWHCCLNLEPSMAITQNYAPRSSARAIHSYLRAGDKAGDLVSGVPLAVRPQMADEFAKVLREYCPQALEPEEPRQAAAEAEAEAGELTRADGTEAGSKEWNARGAKGGSVVMGTAEEQGLGFSFGFG